MNTSYLLVLLVFTYIHICLFETLFDNLAHISISINSQGIYAIDTFPVAVCDNIRISRCCIYQGKQWCS